MLYFRGSKKPKYAESSEEEMSEESEEEEEVKPKKGRGRRNDPSSSKRGRPSRSAACKRGSYGKQRLLYCYTPPQTNFGGYIVILMSVRSFSRPSQSLIRYSSKTAEQNFMKLSGIVHYMMPYCTSYFKFLFE